MDDQQPTRPKKPKATHYKIVCISLYNEDLDRLDAVVQELKRKGYRRANRSAVLRAAMVEFGKNPDRVNEYAMKGRGL